MRRDPGYTRRLLLGRGFGAALLLPAAGRASGARVQHRHMAPQHAGPLLVLDPGHGGKDPGAIGASGVFEKHVAFAAAQELARQLRAHGYRVALTRGNDVFVPLEQRVAFAQGQGAALFISLHADAVSDARVQGASVYTLAATASDEQSAFLAKSQNEVDSLGGPHFAGASSPEVDAILASLVRRETRLGSAHAQRDLVHALAQSIPMLENPARHAEFAVLRAADIPSVLVEMGFMSNPRDEATLCKPAHRVIVAAAIRKAVDSYFAAKAASA